MREVGVSVPGMTPMGPKPRQQSSVKITVKVIVQARTMARTSVCERGQYRELESP